MGPKGIDMGFVDMGFVRIRHAGRPVWGVTKDQNVAVTSAGALAELLDAPSLAESPVDTIALADVEWLAPVDETAKILCIGLNYRDHAAEFDLTVPDNPVVFMRYADSLVGHNAPLLVPHESDTFDYEAELAVVIGKGGRRISREDALDHVLGHTIFNDGSIREYQRHTPQFGPGKNFFESGSAGPVIVPSAEFQVGAQRITTTIGGEILQDSTLDQLVFDVPALIEYISRWTPLRPGDMIATGTTAGVGGGRDPKRWMLPGETVEVAIEGLGVLSNPIIKEP